MECDAGRTERDTTPSVIEFGELDEEISDDLPPAVPFRTVGDEEPQHPLLSAISEAANGEEEFQPAGTIHPEVELHFQRTANPFHEAFDEEELVLDPYIAAETVYREEASNFESLLAKLASAEEAEPASSSTPWAGGLPNAQFHVAESPEREEPDVDDEIQSTIHPAAKIEAREASETEPSDAWRHVPELQETETSEAQGADVLPPAPKLPKLSPPIPVTRLPPSLGSESDEDMIVVDDLPRPPAPELTKEPPPKRRHEFRQLFAKLRRE